MKKIVFVTGNEYKFQVAQKALAGLPIKLIQKKLETPEIQSTKVTEIASFSAKWAADKLKKPVFLSDAGYYIEALNGFPGPFIKCTNSWLTAEDYLRLMKGKKNRKVITKDCIAYCEPGSKPITFCGKALGTIAQKVGKKGTTSINEIYIPEGFNKVESEIPRKQMLSFWGKRGAHWQAFAKYLKKLTA
jgi:XTP/dITP diphosphohydrolase